MTDSQKKERYVPINKGHFELDTEERTREFSRKLSLGWEAEYSEYRKMWNELPKNRTVRDYPLLVDLEMSTVCNLHCPMCPTTTEEFQQRVPKKFMDIALLKKIVDEIAGKVFSVRLSLVGESTLHPDFISAIRYTKEAGVREVSFLTNGSKLDLDYFEQIAEAGADWITISIDGLAEAYDQIRKPLKFVDMLEKLKAIKDYKDSRSRTKPVIKVQSVWPAIRSNPTAFYEQIAPLVDLVAFNPLIDYLHKDSDIVYEDGFSCPQLYQRVVICSDGKAKLCSNDEWRMVIVGDAERDTIYDIWHGDGMNRAREIHARLDGFKSMESCKLCYYPRKAVPNERSFVGEREIWVENYVNRSQVLGE